MWQETLKSLFYLVKQNKGWWELPAYKSTKKNCEKNCLSLHTYQKTEYKTHPLLYLGQDLQGF